MGEKITTARKIPRHLWKYVADQQYEKYSPIDYAVWRYVMRQNHHFLKNTAHQAYVGGLKSSGISVEKIPNVEDLNEARSPFGWDAPNIFGVIPSVVFLGLPFGKLKNIDHSLVDCTDEELKAIGIMVGTDCLLEYESGAKVKGTPTHFFRKNSKLLVIKFANCTVSINNEILFDPGWGTYDLAIREKITSVFAGAADSEQFDADLEAAETKPLVKAELTPLELLYGQVRNIRETAMDKNSKKQELREIVKKLTNEYKQEWLLRVEIIELLTKEDLLLEEQIILKEQLEEIKLLHEEYPVLIERGIMLAGY